MGVEKLIDTLKAQTYLPQRNPEGPFIYSVDHCFSIRGQGTVMTGTVVSGSIAVNDVSHTDSAKYMFVLNFVEMCRLQIFFCFFVSFLLSV